MNKINKPLDLNHDLKIVDWKLDDVTDSRLITSVCEILPLFFTD